MLLSLFGRKMCTCILHSYTYVSLKNMLPYNLYRGIISKQRKSLDDFVESSYSIVRSIENIWNRN